jgi:hypothetical protein
MNGEYEEESDQTESQQKYPGQRTERDEIERTAPIVEPVRFPFDRIERLALEEQTFFIKPERLLEVDLDLFGQAVAGLLLQHETAKESAPHEIDKGEQERLGYGKMDFDGSQQQREGHHRRAERAEGGQPHHVLAAFVHFLLVQGIQNRERLLHAFGDHDGNVCLTVDKRPTTA